MIKKNLEISAIIPAAGLSTRMHMYKPLLKISNSTIVEHTISSLKKCKIKDIIVVTGHNHEKIKPVIVKAGARPIFNKKFKAGMLGSIKTGVQALSSQTGGFLLLPVDIPMIRPATINNLISVFKKTGEDIIIPQFNGKPGHPPVIPAWLIPEILNLKNPSNLGTLLLSLKSSQQRHIVHDHGVLMDADTQEAYESLKAKHASIDIPDIEECQSIIHANLKEEKNIQDHVKLVAKSAVALTKAIQAKTFQKKLNRGQADNTILDIEMIHAGALLHDIRRKEADHAAKGAQYLLSLGFTKIADIVAQHMDLTLPLPDRLTKAQIVYFADKLCNGGNFEPDLNYSNRFQTKIKQTPQAKEIILKRYEHTKIIQTRIEKLSGRSVKSILQKI